MSKVTDITSVHEEVIRSKEQELFKAMKTSNVKKLDELIHPALLFNLPNGAVTTKMMDLAAYESGGMSIAEIEPEETRINSIGDNAVVSVSVRMKGTFQGQPFEGTFRVLRVWKQIDQQWQIIAGSSVYVAP